MTDLMDRPAPPGKVAPSGRLGVRALVVFYVSSLVGTGILLVPGLTERQAGPASVLAWLALAVCSYPFARFFAEMSAWRPDASGLAAMVGAGLGARPGRAAALLLVATYVIGNPVMGIVSARCLLGLLGQPDGPVYPLAMGFMALSAAFTLLGLAAGARVQAASLVVLLLGLGGAVVIAAPRFDAGEYTPFLTQGWGGVGIAVVTAFFSFLGWENVSTLAEQVDDPARSYRRAIRWAVPIVGLLYAAVTAAYLAVPGDEPVVITALLGASLGETGAVVGDLLALGLAVVATNAWVLGATRVVRAAARDRILPRVLADRPVPATVVLTLAYTAVLTALLFTGTGEEIVLIVTSSGFLLLYVAAAVAALRARGTGRALRTTAVVTLVIAAVFLSFAGTGLLLALLLAAGCAAVTARTTS
ncbi:APC family permease [Streptomyces sp. Je 1-79]|uniref:APC family permease n=1 Tax=Streptomyces sp. Je 1-79 TaxID=2943847 RepID=UPI0021A50F2E|nr:APC family permease [Streptomyces sp. Je 1-79]MCT4354576.1 APC family permease [Streptomyces sp. Je 1-79]